MFANGIPPYVRGDFFDGIRRAKNVVVVAHFPERLAAKPSKFESGTLLEKTDKLAEIGTVVRAFGEEVDVVRHDAIRVQEKGMAGGAFVQDFHDGKCERRRSEELVATVAADGDEVDLAAEIIVGGETGIFSVESHLTDGR